MVDEYVLVPDDVFEDISECSEMLEKIVAGFANVEEPTIEELKASEQAFLDLRAKLKGLLGEEDE